MAALGERRRPAGRRNWLRRVLRHAAGGRSRTFLVNSVSDFHRSFALTQNISPLRCFKRFSVMRYSGKAMRSESAFSSRQVMALTGITARQLQWWDERGIVVPARRAHQRLYSLDDLAEVAVICDLRGRGFSLQRVRKVVRLLQRDFGKRLAQIVGEKSEYHLLTDGDRLFLETSARQVLDILKSARQPMLSVCLSDKMRQIRSDIRRKKSAQPAAAVRRGSKTGS